MPNSVQPNRRQSTRLGRPWDSPGKNTGVGCHFLLQCMKVKVKVKSLSTVWLFATPWTAAHQAPLSMGFSRQEYWSGVPLPWDLYQLSITINQFSSVAQSCPTLCDPAEGSPPGSAVPGILQARTLEWVPCSLLVRNRLQPPRPSPSSKGQTQTVAN